MSNPTDWQDVEQIDMVAATTGYAISGTDKPALHMPICEVFLAYAYALPVPV